jgi:DNA-binding transcriptional LysR family regulator
MLDVAKLATLREVIARGSFSAAGQALQLTQPAVSRQVALLERRLGTQLVRRTRQGVVPTEAGRRLAEHAEAIVGRLARAEAEVAALAGLRAGRARIGMFFTAFALLAPEVEALAERRHPGLELEYVLADRRTAFRRLHAAELDLAVVFEHASAPAPPPPGIELVPLFDDPATVLLPAGHRLAARARLTVSDVAGERWIRAHDGAAARLLDHILGETHPSVQLAGHGDEPVEGQVYVTAGAGVMLAHALNVIVNRDGIAIRPLTDAPPRRVQAAIAADQRAPAARAALALLQALR